MPEHWEVLSGLVAECRGFPVVLTIPLLGLDHEGVIVAVFPLPFVSGRPSRPTAWSKGGFD